MSYARALQAKVGFRRPALRSGSVVAGPCPVKSRSGIALLDTVPHQQRQSSLAPIIVNDATRALESN